MSHYGQINANYQKIDDLRRAMRKLNSKKYSISNLTANAVISVSQQGWKGTNQSKFSQGFQQTNQEKSTIQQGIETAISDYDRKIDQLENQIDSWREMDRREEEEREERARTHG